MTMTASAYRSRANEYQEVVRYLMIRFTGELRDWWDKYLKEHEREFILNKRTPTSEAVAVDTLIFAITKFFIGDSRMFQNRAFEILLHLKCPKLSDFRWYTDVFFSNILKRDDGKEPFWKEIFLSNLPKTFEERVKMRIREKYDSNIPYEILTYGELISYIYIYKPGGFSSVLFNKNQLESKK